FTGEERMSGIASGRLKSVILLSTLLLVVAAACGEEAPETDTGGGGGDDSGAQFETIEEGIFTVGSCLDYRPFEFVKDGEEQGFDVEMVEAIAEKLNLEVQWKKANFDTIFTAQAANKFDMVAAASTILPEREEIVDFSDPYFNSRQALTINTAESGDVASADDLGEGDIVAVQKGTTGKLWAEDNLAPNGVEIKTFDAAPDAFTDLEAGNVQAVVNDEGSSIAEVEQRSGLEIAEAIDTDEKYGFAFSKDNPELTEAANGALQEIIDEGTYADIFSKWFPDLPVPPEYEGN
ncbi:MAG: transporter substrate-binding domain-containing protein, partial [Actinomycetota bacterium]|nr:transporter substrate-binding domain-containing protein [Actinomycetota bacterium]